MTVLLLGVGADGDHVRPKLQLDSSGCFDYIPIPETETEAETITYGEWELNNREDTAADIITGIAPHGDGNWITDSQAIADHPIHYDPNFEALTFGDRISNGGKGGTIIKNIDSDDILGFYTGIKRHPDDSDFHRYLYGYMTVNEVHNLSELSGDEYHQHLRRFPENAHAKRLIGSGEPKHKDVVIVDGCEPAEKLTKPIRISERIDQSPWYKITDEFARDFSVETGLKGICRKFPVTLDIEPEEFVEKIHKW